MLKKKFFTAFAVIFLLMSWGAAAGTSSGVSPAKTRQSLDIHMTALKSLFPNLQGIAVDHSSGMAVLTVFASADEHAEVLAKQSKAETLLAVPVRINIISAPLNQQ